MTEYMSIGSHRLAYDLQGDGPLVVLAHGMGDSRRSYRFVMPALVAAGYRVANLDIRGCGESSTDWPGYSRTDIAGDLVALVKHLGGPAVLVGQSISGGAGTIAAADAPDLIAGVVELAPFTRKQSMDLAGMLRVQPYRAASVQLMLTMLRGNVANWLKYLDTAIPVKPADWASERSRIAATMQDPGHMKVLQAMMKTTPVDAGARLADVASPVLIIQGSADPDWADPRAEGERIIADLPAGLGRLEVIEGAGHYPHAQTPNEVLDLMLPFLAGIFGEPDHA
ncbi:MULTISPECIES: alpha/beta fold hydrolase [unclassified Arthrobacter]|uniref:alpha/beta fold hydrolase n=2 Tax=Arthrobacter TaxID=1663 RepID=UPI001D155218|nr:MULTISPECIES: alpha/beta hydrolase [unclassified Arthrobacter]MCC3276263.1 alpha/beta hydrolase [Arthrobacter sp. zg-Y20]MDK1316423.1 alpha/beta hydrolase [Arthrobacter sp. zg.Y20]